ncbi:MAG TPA: hypothetical protein VGC69_02525 [Bordetella sp.]
MKIPILGAGRLGTRVAANLVPVQNDIAAIDTEPAPPGYLQERNIMIGRLALPTVPRLFTPLFWRR